MNKNSLVAFLLLCASVLSFSGCASTVEIAETYTKPAEINMAGRKTVVLESSRSGATAADGAMVVSRLRQQLLAKNFTVVDRSAMDAKAREAFFGDGGEEEVKSASVLIRIGVLRNAVRTEREQDERVNYVQLIADKDSDADYMVYRTVARADAEVSFDVIDLGSTSIITSSTIASSQTTASEWSQEGYGSVDASSALSKSYDDIVSKFMRKIAPYSVRVEHEVYAMDDSMPQAKVGVALLQAGRPDDAYREFAAALDVARSTPGSDPKDMSLLIHNMAVAKEQDGAFQEALDLYIESTRYEGAPDQSENIVRCQQRLQDQSRLRDQGAGY